jgi:hypothetical protein
MNKLKLDKAEKEILEAFEAGNRKSNLTKKYKRKLRLLLKQISKKVKRIYANIR